MYVCNIVINSTSSQALMGFQPGSTDELWEIAESAKHLSNLSRSSAEIKTNKVSQ